MTKKIETGNRGEEIARQYLMKRGYRVIESNVKVSYKELDIVARKGDRLFFVEVKTRTSFSLGKADEIFSTRKTRNLKLAAMLYLIKNKPGARDAQLDLICVDLSDPQKGPLIEHYEDIA